MEVLLVEDEALIALDLASIIEEAGYAVLGPFSSLPGALDYMTSGSPDIAVLDFNLADRTSEELADLLLEKQVPFVFLTGYARDHIPRRFENVEILHKPIVEPALVAFLDRHRNGRDGG